MTKAYDDITLLPSNASQCSEPTTSSNAYPSRYACPELLGHFKLCSWQLSIQHCTATLILVTSKDEGLCCLWGELDGSRVSLIAFRVSLDCLWGKLDGGVLVVAQVRWAGVPSREPAEEARGSFSQGWQQRGRGQGPSTQPQLDCAPAGSLQKG